MKLDVIAHIYAAPGEEAVVREVLESYVAPTRLEGGCLRYDLFIDLADASQFTFIEEWTNAEALLAHSQSKHITEGRAQLQGKFRQPGWVQKLERIV